MGDNLTATLSIFVLLVSSLRPLQSFYFMEWGELFRPYLKRSNWSVSVQCLNFRVWEYLFWKKYFKVPIVAKLSPLTLRYCLHQNMFYAKSKYDTYLNAHHRKQSNWRIQTIKCFHLLDLWNKSFLYFWPRVKRVCSLRNQCMLYCYYSVSQYGMLSNMYFLSSILVTF